MTPLFTGLRFGAPHTYLADKEVVLIAGEEVSRTQLEHLFEPDFAAALWSALVNTAGKAVL